MEVKVLFLKFLTIAVFLYPVVLKSQESKNLANSNTGLIIDPAQIFIHPPESAKPGVLWMWMGSNLSREGITKDLEELKKAGFNRTTMFSLSDITTPWSNEIRNSPTPELISWTEPWWKLVRFAAEESKRLGMDFGMFNGPGYESSGGNWITPELSMQDLCWSENLVNGNTNLNIKLKRPQVDLRSKQRFPVFNSKTGLVEKPEIEERGTYYKEVAVLALPASGLVKPENVINLTDKMKPDGHLEWKAPPGDWLIYRFGNTTMGTLIQPAQWQAIGFECDKMSQRAIDFHMDHVIGEIQKHLGDLIGTGFTHVHFDSYEAGNPTWTPKMTQEFAARRGYSLLPYLATFAGRTIGSKQDSSKFRTDFKETIKDLYRDIYFTSIAKKLKKAKLDFLCEPYGGPWRQDEIMPLIPKVMTEFWTNDGKYRPYQVDETISSIRKSGQNIVEAEAFTGLPMDSKWSETPAWLKPIGDAAFCAGINKMILHRFVQQPWDDRFRPGATMGQWGTHFDRTQTWWKPAIALFEYWQRCQALLQWGEIATRENDFTSKITEGNLAVNFIHRKGGETDIYFVANTSHNTGKTFCSFNVSGMQPELWDPVRGTMKDIAQFTKLDGHTSFTIPFDDAQSYFVVFRKKASINENHFKNNSAIIKEVVSILGDWKVSFDPIWGGPSKPVTFSKLEDWTTRPEKGIKYYSGTAIYRTTFNVKKADKQQNLFLNLGVVNHIARVVVNNKDLGVVWTAPWTISIPAHLLKNQGNTLEIQVTNVWANRLIGDEQEPADCEWLPGHQSGFFLKAFPEWFIKDQPRPSQGRYCFTTWNYFTKDSPLISSGLLGPVKLMQEK